jgi:hypothetical protein
MRDEEREISGVELVDHPFNEQKKVFTKMGETKLIDLLTEGDVRVGFRGEGITLSILTDDQAIVEILRVKFSNVIASSIDQIEEASSEEARCQLYGIAGLLREAAKEVERAAREIDEDKWRDVFSAHFIPTGDDFPDLYLPKDLDDIDPEEKHIMANDFVAPKVEKSKKDTLSKKGRTSTKKTPAPLKSNSEEPQVNEE